MFSRHPNFTAPNATIEARVSAMLDRMTREEKINLLGGRKPDGWCTAAVERVGLPSLHMADGPVGVHWWCEQSTAYPALIALAASFDRELAYRVGTALGRDCRSRGVHILLAPGVNLYRSPRCGRNFEYMGEDPILAGRMSAQYIQGLQDQGVAATVKHFAGNFQEYSRHFVSTDADERTLREVYLRQFEIAVRDGGAACLMTAYNSINGQHCSENSWLLQTVLKGEWGFQGVAMSDWCSLYSVVGPIANGIDLEMPWADRLRAAEVQVALDQGRITMGQIDDKIRRVIRLAACFGWLDHAQQDTSIPADDPTSAAVAHDVARSGLVLLKNQGGLLPLARAATKKLVVIGHHADGSVRSICGGGSAFTKPFHFSTVLAGLRQIAGPDVTIEYHRGIEVERDLAMYKEALFTAPDGSRGLRLELFNNLTLDGAPDHVSQQSVVDNAWCSNPPAEGFTNTGYSARWTGSLTATESSEHTFSVRTIERARGVFLLDGVVVVDTEQTGQGSGIIRAMKNLEANRTYQVEIRYLGSGRDWNVMHAGWEPSRIASAGLAAAIAAAATADAVVVAVGFTADTESEGYDRSFALDPMQVRMIEAVVAANPRTICTLHAGGAVDTSGWLDRVPALVDLFYPGQEGGIAAAELIFGDIDARGRLPFAWERQASDRPGYDHYLDTDKDLRVALTEGVFSGQRGHDHSGIAPLFPFGFGLSYTRFAMSDLTAGAPDANGTVAVTVRVSNTGARSGTAVVQLYIGTPDATIPRPQRELKDFATVTLAAGASSEVRCLLDQRAFTCWHPDQKAWIVEPGRYRIAVGWNAADLPLATDLVLMG